MFFFHGNDYSAVYCSIEPLLDSLNSEESAFLHSSERQDLNAIVAENYRRGRLAARICAKYLWAAPQKNGGVAAADIA